METFGKSNGRLLLRRGASLAASLLLVAGCASLENPGDLADELGPGHLLIRIGHTDSPQDELIVGVDGTEEHMWSESPQESAAMAVCLFVKCAYESPVQPEDFIEIRRFRPRDGSANRVILERRRDHDVHARMFRVQLSDRGGVWVPEMILVCHGSLSERADDYTVRQGSAESNRPPMLMVATSGGAIAEYGSFALPQEGGVPELRAARVKALPRIDGKADDSAWKSAGELVVRIDMPSNLKDPERRISLRAVHDGDSIAFLLVWEDPTRSVVHMPYSWDNEKKKYVPSDDCEIEDAAAIGFPHAGSFNPDMKAAAGTKWDVWHWKAARTNPGGYAQDRLHIYSKTKPEGLKSRKFNGPNDEPIWIARPEDEGRSVIRHLSAPSQRKADKVPQYEAQEPTGSAADVRAKGVWQKGKWTVEFQRKLKTGHDDDTPFDFAKPILFAVSTFDEMEQMNHDVSGTLKLTLAK